MTTLTLMLLVCAGLTVASAVWAIAARRPDPLERFERYAGRPGGPAKGGHDLTVWRDVLIEALAPRLERFLPSTYLQGLKSRLRRAGFYGPGHFQAFLVLQAVLAALASVVCVASGWQHAPAMIALGAAIGVLTPMVVVGQLAAIRQQAVHAMLPDSIDLLTACVEAGLGLDAAVAHLVKRRSRACWAINQEFERYLAELHMGVARTQALRNLADRCQVEDLRHLVNAIAQGDALGVGIAQVLRGQSQHLRLRRKQRAEEKAMKAPIKIIFPLLVGVFPSVFVVILGPAVIKLMTTFSTTH